jgi:hypothetical protein
MASLDDEVDPFDAMLEEVIASMEPLAKNEEPAKPELLPEVHSLPLLPEKHLPPLAKAANSQPRTPAKPIVKRPSGPLKSTKPVEPAEVEPTTKKKVASSKPPTTKKLATSSKRKSSSSKRPAVPALGFARPAAPPVSGNYGTTKGAPAKTKIRRSSTAPSIPDAEALVAATPLARPQVPSRTGYTTVVPALQPPRPYGASHNTPERIPTSKLRAVAAARRAAEKVAAESEASAASQTPASQRPRRRRSPAFGAGVLARYKR